MQTRWPGQMTGAAVALLGCVLCGRSALADTLTGILRSVNAKARRIIVVDSDGDDNRLYVARKARISLNRKRAKLADLRAGDAVLVTFREDAEGRAAATAIAATRSKQQSKGGRAARSFAAPPAPRSGANEARRPQSAPAACQAGCPLESINPPPRPHPRRGPAT